MQLMIQLVISLEKLIILFLKKKAKRMHTKRPTKTIETVVVFVFSMT